MASVELLELSSPVARHGHGTRGPRHCIASSTTTSSKRSDPAPSSRSVVRQWVTFTQVAFNLDDAPPANTVTKFGEVGEDSPCFPPQLSYGELPHQCPTFPCNICGKGKSDQPAQRSASTHFHEISPSL